MTPGGMSDLAIPDFEPAAECHDCGWELGACDCLTEPASGSMTAGHGNLPEAHMLTERQADILIHGQTALVGSVARTLESCDNTDSRHAAERVIATVADWLSGYRPPDLGAEYIGPLDLTAFILRKGEVLDR